MQGALRLSLEGGTVSSHVRVGDTIKGVAVPGLDSLKPHLPDWETKTRMVETHHGANAREVKALQVKNDVGCLGSHGNGMGHPIQIVDRDILSSIVGSIDALARERLDIDVACTRFLVSPLCDVQNITVGRRGSTGAWIQRQR